MRAWVPSLTLASALLAPATLPAPAAAVPPRQAPAARGEGAVAATDLLARVGECDQISHGRYRTDADSPAAVPVCGTRNAVFWKAGLNIDCDGQSTARCNRRTDPPFAPATAFQQSDGRPLNAETLPYIAIPAPSRIWDPGAYGVRDGSVVAVVFRDRVQYAVVGDIGPRDQIGEASYATARGLGIWPDPRAGGVASGVERTHAMSWAAAGIGMWTIIAPFIVSGARSAHPASVIVSNAVVGGLAVVFAATTGVLGLMAKRRA